MWLVLLTLLLILLGYYLVLKFFNFKKEIERRVREHEEFFVNEARKILHETLRK